jgi:uncharacterized protein
MQLEADSKLLRIFVGELDKIGHQPLYEAILFKAKEQGLAGCTILRGIMSFGPSSRVHTAKLIDISSDLPIVIEIVDHEDKLNTFIPVVDKMMEECGQGGLITIEKAEVLYYKHKKIRHA